MEVNEDINFHNYESPCTRGESLRAPQQPIEVESRTKYAKFAMTLVEQIAVSDHDKHTHRICNSAFR